MGAANIPQNRSFPGEKMSSGFPAIWCMSVITSALSARYHHNAMNEKALKSFEGAGNKLKSAGERLNKVAKARQEFNQAWQKRLEANIPE
jgi:hypothetical protein